MALTPRRFIVFRDEQQMVNMKIGEWTDLIRGAEFNNLAMIDGEDEDDRYFWCILSRKRKTASLCEEGKNAGHCRRFRRTAVLAKQSEDLE